jgi:hypothetical protein
MDKEDTGNRDEGKERLKGYWKEDKETYREENGVLLLI